MRSVLNLSLSLLLLNVPGQMALAAPRTAVIQGQQAQATATKLSNKDVVYMVKTGIAADVIIAKIKASPCDFDTSPVALRELKTGGVPDSVLLAMVHAATSASANSSDTAIGPGAGRREVTVPDGTPLEVQLMYEVTSADAKEGDTIFFRVINPVVIDGATVIDRDAQATARIVVAKKRGHWGKAGKLGWAMQDVIAADGSHVPVRVSAKKAGDSKSMSVATATIITGVLFFPAAPFWGFKKGKNAIFPAGKRFDAYIHGDAKVQGKLNTERASAP